MKGKITIEVEFEKIADDEVENKAVARVICAAGIAKAVDTMEHLALALNATINETRGKVEALP